MKPSIETPGTTRPTNTRWYSFVYEFRSAAEAPVELIEVLEREREWLYAVFFPRMEATSNRPASPATVCVPCKSVLRIYRIGDEWEVTCQEIPLALIHRIMLQLYLLRCSIRIVWSGGDVQLRFPAHAAEHVLTLSQGLTGPEWEKTVAPEPVLGYGVEITLRRPG